MSDIQYGTAQYSPAVPAVYYERRAGGWAIRVQREGKGGHLTLVAAGWNRWQIIDRASTRGGVVGLITACCRDCDDTYVVTELGPLDFTAEGGVRPGGHLGTVVAEVATLADAIGEAGLRWIF